MEVVKKKEVKKTPEKKVNASVDKTPATPRPEKIEVVKNVLFNEQEAKLLKQSLAKYVDSNNAEDQYWQVALMLIQKLNVQVESSK